jgi:hypothetical protein
VCRCRSVYPTLFLVESKHHSRNAPQFLCDAWNAGTIPRP